MTEQDISTNKPSKTLKDFQNVYDTVESWYATLKGERKTWVDDNWKSMLEKFIDYAEQSLEESLSEEKGKESEHFCDVHEEEPILHDGNGGFMCQVCDDECKEE
jgi:hypothetical protein